MFSFLLTITAVICWSMKINIVPNKAGRHATIALQNGLWWKGDMIHPRPSNVGLNSAGTSSFGVGMPTKWSNVLIENIAINTAKSLTTCLTWNDKWRLRNKFGVTNVRINYWILDVNKKRNDLEISTINNRYKNFKYKNNNEFLNYLSFLVTKIKFYTLILIFQSINISKML